MSLGSFVEVKKCGKNCWEFLQQFSDCVKLEHSPNEGVLYLRTWVVRRLNGLNLIFPEPFVA